MKSRLSGFEQPEREPDVPFGQPGRYRTDRFGAGQLKQMDIGGRSPVGCPRSDPNAESPYAGVRKQTLVKVRTDENDGHLRHPSSG